MRRSHALPQCRRPPRHNAAPLFNYAIFTKLTSNAPILGDDFICLPQMASFIALIHSFSAYYQPICVVGSAWLIFSLID